MWKTSSEQNTDTRISYVKHINCIVYQKEILMDDYYIREVDEKAMKEILGLQASTEIVQKECMMTIDIIV